MHTFESFGGTSGCPSDRGDFVSDTPSQRVSGDRVIPLNTCPVEFNVDSCPSNRGLDPLRNFMDYTDDTCKDFDGDEGYTTGQVARMVASWNMFRTSDDTIVTTPMEVTPIVMDQPVDVYIEIQYDRRYFENEWGIFDSNSEAVVGVARGRGRSLVSGTVQMPPGDYTFIIVDDGGDGICCRYGFGYVLVQVNGVDVVFSTGFFGNGFQQSFTVSPASNQRTGNDPETEISEGENYVLLKVFWLTIAIFLVLS